MTPQARVAAAIGLLDDILAGQPAERVLTRWARASRYAGSRDRAAIRDLVFDALRRRRSAHWMSGQNEESGRGIIMGTMAAEPGGIPEVFDGCAYGPAQATASELAALRCDVENAPPPVMGDYPDFLHAELLRSHGKALPAIMKILQERAPVDLRVNSLRADMPRATATLQEDDIRVEPVLTVPNAMRVVDNPRRVATSKAYREGMVELQDAASQAVVQATRLEPGMQVLDYCAGGGGKSLAMAALLGGQGKIYAHDVNPARMRDIPTRAARAGCKIDLVDTRGLARLTGQCDLVLVDAPCSGTGAWRRNPDAKWRLTPQRLNELTELQHAILRRAHALVRPGGRLVYATCSILNCENQDIVTQFLTTTPNAQQITEHSLTVGQIGDGFYFSDIFLS